MKLEKNERTPYIMKNTKHFNDVSPGLSGVVVGNEGGSERSPGSDAGT